VGEIQRVDPVAARAAVAAVGARMSALVRSIKHPEAPALGTWNTTDLAVHISHSLDIVTSIALDSAVTAGDIWQLSALNAMLVSGESERDLGVIATRIDSSVAALLAALRDGADQEAGDGGVEPLRSWLVEGVRVPLSTVACHALNELVVHGFDLAKADGAPWPIDRAHASLVFRGFLLPMLRELGRSLLDEKNAAGVKVTYHIVLRGGGGEGYLRFHDGDVEVSDTAPGPVDCHLSVDPAAFVLVSYGRIGQWPAILKGKLFAYGRKPWMGLELSSLVRTP
jgi:SCP-2 sterol transfer family